MLNDDILHDQIIKFYDGAVDDLYAERCIDFYHNKKRSFSWLFGDKDRIKVSISDLEAVDFFYAHNSEFQNLYYDTLEFLEKMDSSLSIADLKLAIFKNRILYKKNEYKFSKFFNRFVKPQERIEFNFGDLPHTFNK